MNCLSRFRISRRDDRPENPDRQHQCRNRGLNTLTKQRKREVDQAKILIGNYKEQQNNVRNNREFDAITKEIEYRNWRSNWPKSASRSMPPV